MQGLDQPAADAVVLLNLDCSTLIGWRRGAIAGFVPPDLELTRDEIEQVVDGLAFGMSRDPRTEIRGCERNIDFGPTIQRAGPFGLPDG